MNPRQYILALYKVDVTGQPVLDADEQIALARIIRCGMLCDCSIMPDDPKVPDEYPYKLADRTSKVAWRLNPSEEEKKWVESLTRDEKQRFILDGRAAQEKLISGTLPLVMSIAAKEHNGLGIFFILNLSILLPSMGTSRFMIPLNSVLSIGST